MFYSQDIFLLIPGRSVIGYSKPGLTGRHTILNLKSSPPVAVYRIPVNRLSPEALEGVIGEFITRYGTDYGEIDFSWERKFNQVKSRLQSGQAVLLYDGETETTAIVPATDPILKQLEPLTE